MSRKKISTTIYVTPEQSEKLKLLHERTKVPVAVYIREGIDLVLRHYGHLLPGQLPLDGGAPQRNERSQSSAYASRSVQTSLDAGDAGEHDDSERGSIPPATSSSGSLAGHSAHAASKK